MLEYTEEEKKVIEGYKEEFKDYPSWAIEEGLTNSYFSIENIPEFTEKVYEYTKRFLVQVAKKRNLEFDENASFDLEDIFEDKDFTGIEDFNIEYLKDYDTLKKYIDDKSKDLSAEETEDLLHDFSGIGSVHDQFRFFMTGYIPRIIENIEDLNFEIENLNEENEEITVEDEGVDFVDDIPPIPTESETDLVDVVDLDDWPDLDDWVDEESEMNKQVKETKEQKQKITDDELIEFIKFLNSWPKIREYKGNGEKLRNYFYEVVKNKKLNSFFENKEFMTNFEKIMAHDRKKNLYLFHGTQCLEDAESIMKQGLGMMKDDLSSTSYAEFSKEDVILYSRGFGGEIGSEAIIIIDNPINEDGDRENIVEELDQNNEIDFCPSGLQGLNGRPKYIVDTKYIIGYVNKRDKKIEFNPRYYDFDKFQENKEEPKFEINEFGEIIRTENTKTPLQQREEELAELEEEEKKISEAEALIKKELDKKENGKGE